MPAKSSFAHKKFNAHKYLKNCMEKFIRRRIGKKIFEEDFEKDLSEEKQR